ncbi:MAG: hypothetical protein MJD61_09535 [Proteobacteria bacterium]|nr:hypothetical protein [Pseudomonadota bacterium]
MQEPATRLQIRLTHLAHNSSACGAVLDSLRGLEGVAHAVLDRSQGNLLLRYDATRTSPHEILGRVRRAGLMQHTALSEAGTTPSGYGLASGTAFSGSVLSFTANLSATALRAAATLV